MGVKRKENRRHRHRASRRKSSRPHKNGRKGTFFLSNAPALRDFWLLSHGYGGGNAFLSIYFIAFQESRGTGAKCKHYFAQYYEYIEPVELQLAPAFLLQPRLVPIPRGRFRGIQLKSIQNAPTRFWNGDPTLINPLNIIKQPKNLCDRPRKPSISPSRKKKVLNLLKRSGRSPLESS